MAFLELHQVSKRFGSSAAVADFNLAAERGELVSFLGPSGCGKTTTLRMIAGFELPSSGRIVVDGEDITRRPASQRRLGMVFQSYALFPNLTVADNIGFGLRVAGAGTAVIRSRVEEMLRLIDMARFAERYPHQLSGGQQQRVALARALAIKPRVLLLDEPLSALDAKIRASLRQEIRDIQRQLGITTIFVTHDQEEALSLSDRVVVMNAGQIEQIGTPFEIYNHPQTSFVASFVGTLNLLPAEVVDAGAGRVRVAGQEIQLASPIEQALGSRVQLALRPEAIGIKNGHGTNELHGTVEDLAFLGSIVRVRVRLGENELHFDTFNSPHLALPQRGEPIALSFEPESGLVLQ
jgi:putative spermidine/putrescine transport system ATP-binding protein